MNYSTLPAIITGLLQLAVACYALRLNRVYGIKRVGVSLFSAFSLLAILNLVQSFLQFDVDGMLSIKIEVVRTLIALLLLIGMVHIESVFKERLRLERESARIRADLEHRVSEQTASLTKANQALQSEVIQRKAQAAALQTSEAQYRLLFSANPYPTLVVDRQTLRILEVNEAAIQHYGYSLEEFRNVTIRNLQTDNEHSAFLIRLAEARSGVKTQGVWRHYKRDQTPMDVEITAVDFLYHEQEAWLILANDITEHLRLEGELHQAQKMQAIGQLAGGVAHDFNNILAVVEGYASILLQEASDPEAIENLSQIRLAGRRGANLTRQLLTFSRRQSMRSEPLDLNTVILDLTKMLRRLIGEDVVLEHACDRTLPGITGDAGMIEQIIVNLAVNARDAMPQGGTIEVTTEVVQVDEAHVRCQREARIGQYVCLRVRDTGTGMPDEVLAHIFEPFFTTKDIGKGTGLGLATVYGIVRQHQGWVEVTSQVGTGTEFRILLPVSEETPSKARTTPLEPSDSGSKRGTILLVEDDEPVRQMLRGILIRNGYHVFEANCGTAALSKWKAEADQVDLLITDIIMPGGITGKDLADQIRRHQPDLKVIFMSGYSPSRAGNDAKYLEGLSFLPKPFGSEVLLREINKCMAG